jgi:hypothetical protein
VDTFGTYFAPADFNETVNTLGQPLYAKQEPRKFDRGTDLHTQSNPLPMCHRPGVLVKLSAADPGWFRVGGDLVEVVMQSIREQIIQTVVARLTLVASAQGATIRRQPTVPTDRAQLPTLLVFPDSEAVRRVNDRTERELVIRIVALAVGTATEIPEPMADRLMTAAHAALLADVTLGGLALGMEETDTDWQQDDADMDVAALPSRYRITYRTFAHDLTQKG